MRDYLVPVGDRRTRVVEVGPTGGTPVVMHHGSPSGPLEVAGQAAAADAHGLRIVCLGRPGYGGSSAPVTPGLGETAAELVGVLDTLGIQRFGVLGVSGGAPMAAVTALMFSPRVTGLAVLAGVADTALVGDLADWAEDLPALALARAGDLDAAARGFTDAARPVAEAIAAGGTPAPESVVLAVRDTLGHGLAGYANDMLGWTVGWDVPLARLAVPVRLVYGGADEGCPPMFGQWYAERLGGTVEVVAGAGHPAAIGEGYRRVLPWFAGLG